jgi:sialate O-acetylesterase
MRCFFLFIFVISLSTDCFSQGKVQELSISRLFSDHIVIQQKTKVNIWGLAAPRQEVQVTGTWGGRASALANNDGKWKVKLPTPAAGGPYQISIQAEGSFIQIKDVLIGEVWLASGQSNMDIPLKGWPPGDTIFNSTQEIKKAEHPAIRFIKIPFGVSAIPLDSVGGKWVASSSITAGDFSAAAYFFAVQLYKKLRVPIGIIQSSIGGTPAEAWTSESHLRKIKDFNLQMDNQALGRKNPTKLDSNSPTVLFNAMINPLIPFSIKGIIWYQGESNVGRANQYKRLFPNLIEDWRNKWRIELPFYYVQLAPNIYNAADQHEQGQKLRDAQNYGLKLRKTGMVSTLDIGYFKTSHPPYKQQVGERLARFALKNEYGYKNLVASGPVFKKVIKTGSKLIIEFNGIGHGLTASASGLANFEIAGMDLVYVKADAIIENNKVVVSSPSINNPLFVRYAWGDTNTATLFNKDGLPAATFTSEQ